MINPLARLKAATKSASKWLFSKDNILPASTIFSGFIFYQSLRLRRKTFALDSEDHKRETVKNFRAQEIRRINRYENPDHRMIARRYLETQCESLLVSQNWNQSERDEARAQVDQPVKEASDRETPGEHLGEYFGQLALAFQKDPSHPHTTIGEEAPTSVDS